MASTTATASTSTGASIAPPPELEQNLALLTAHRSVLGVMILSHPSAAQGSGSQQQRANSSPKTTIVRHSGVVFEGELGRKYASAVARIVDSCRQGLEEVGNTEGDDIRFLRLRTKRHELMISPHEGYILVLLHDPST
ncbi:hypothetical protein BKA62DRAFT_699868 [Auriculariales sp. MPI-PUGE-AT-0066]|nr:hypothetical protein BKA62DRAFT_699868 [Auriculariales sp. MPI-PUGE-AT-0066]